MTASLATVDWGKLALRGLGHLAAAAAVLVCGYLIAVIARALARRWLRRYEDQLGPSLSRLVYGSVYCILLVLTVGVSLIALGISPSYVAAAVLVIIVVLGVALRVSVADVAASIIFLIFRPFNRGELIETLGHLGEVRDILMFDTVLGLRDGRLVTLANSVIRQAGVVNLSRLGRIRVDIFFTVPYDENIERVRAVVAELTAADARVLADPPPIIAVQEMTDLGVRILVGPTVATADYWGISSNLLEQIKVRFDHDGIRLAVRPLSFPPERDTQ